MNHSRTHGDMKRIDPVAPTLPQDRQAGSIPGLRDRKKAQQRLELIDIAVSLFKKRGYETVRMEDIAAKAGVSTKTVYNYFRTKRDILIDFLVGDREQVIAAFQQVIATPCGDPIQDLLRLMQADIGEVRLPGEKRLWLEIMAVTVRERGDERFRRYRRMFTSHIEALLDHLQKAGRISPVLDIALAADIIHVLHSENFENFCVAESLPVEGALALARARLELVFQGWTAEPPATGMRRERKETKGAAPGRRK